MYVCLSVSVCVCMYGSISPRPTGVEGCGAILLRAREKTVPREDAARIQMQFPDDNIARTIYGGDEHWQEFSGRKLLIAFNAHTHTSHLVSKVTNTKCQTQSTDQSSCATPCASILILSPAD